MLLPVNLWPATYNTVAHTNRLHAACPEKCSEQVTGEESQTFTKPKFPRYFSQELADRTKTPVTIGLEV